MKLRVFILVYTLLSIKALDLTFYFLFLENHFTKAVKKQEPMDNAAASSSSQGDTASPRRRKPALLISQSPSPRKRKHKTAATKMRDAVSSPAKRKILCR